MKKTWKAIVSDLDGTLLGKDKTISPRLHNAITQFLNKGNFFSIATGRSYEAIEAVCSTLKLTSPQIVFGGAEIVRPEDGTVLHGEYINPETVKEIIKLFQEHDLPFFVEQGGYRFGDPVEGYTATPFKKLSDLNDQNIPKICLVADHIDEAWAVNFAENEIIKKFPDLHPIRSWGPTWKVWDITSSKATKHLAVLRLAELLNIKPEEIVGVGDGYNDYPLLSACGYKVAIETAPEELKSIADFIAPSQANDGVAVLIEKLFL